ncbi:LysR family transcriptional regulator [Microbacterium sp. 1.5R]|uniref:LysR family transcriptional regulator n=1 Tax=Microbacterium sp. 1.5R TaxID=1916917 RepID=UPI0011A52771|nr:LysR family transcriptional regulator [Microbacterium sp. 1.5R]
MSRLSLGQMDALVAVSDHASVTAAADELGISQPSLTRRLQGLEQALGVALLRPSGRGIELTQAGVQAAAAARRALTEVSVIDALAESVRSLAAGSLRLTGLPSLVSSLAPALVGPFHLAHPGVTISMTTEEDPAAVVASLREGRADLAICALDGVPGDLVGIELPSQRFIAVTPGGDDDRPLRDVLTDSTLVTLPAGTSMRATTEEVCRRLGARPARVLTTTQRDGLVRLALAVGGVTVVPDAFAELAVALGGRCIALDDQPARPIGLLHTVDALRNPAVEGLLQDLRG